ncbi:MAG: AlpA family phage regulatory protein [Alphaproteobacteria bacterium]|nr:AlpA family phage regulatory protein [Alphaproteobacteria bacterium]
MYILITLKEVIEITGLKKSTIYKLISEDKFPKQVKIGSASRWQLKDINEWVEKAVEGTYAG